MGSSAGPSYFISEGRCTRALTLATPMEARFTPRAGLVGLAGSRTRNPWMRRGCALSGGFAEGRRPVPGGALVCTGGSVGNFFLAMGIAPSGNRHLTRRSWRVASPKEQDAAMQLQRPASDRLFGIAHTERRGATPSRQLCCNGGLPADTHYTCAVRAVTYPVGVVGPGRFG